MKSLFLECRSVVFAIALLAIGVPYPVYSQAAPTDRLVRIFAQVEDRSQRSNLRRLVTGDTVPAKAMTTILFLDEPCTLSLADAANMRRAWMAYGAYQVGCWYPTVNDQFVFVGALPMMTHDGGIYWESLPRALLHPDGSATITEPGYDSETFLQRVASKKAIEARSHLDEKP